MANESDGSQASDNPAAAEGSQGLEAPKKKSKGLLERPVLLISLIAGVVLVIVIALLWWLHERHFESTDDAFIDARIVRLAPLVAGRVTQVLANDNELVEAGQPLIDIDSATYRTSVAQAQAQKAQAQAQLDNARSQILVSEADYRQALADVSAAQATAENAARDLKRFEALQRLNPAAVAQQQFDQAATTAAQAAAQLDSARKAAAARAQQIAAARSQVVSGQEQINAAQAQLNAADLNLGYARIVAPMAGHVAQETVAVGDYVQPGTQMLAIVPLEIWVTANFKETQLALMRQGQSVAIRVDACPNDHIVGHVDSIQRGAGQAFGILPPQNATGNYVKVVQRVPVKIVFDHPPRDCPLGPGMSVEPTVRVR